MAWLGFQCGQVYALLEGETGFADMKMRCSRHRAQFSPTATPEGFWDLSFPNTVP